MYKIYINGKPLFLAGREHVEALRQRYPGCLAGRYSGQVKTLFHYIDLLEKSPHHAAAIVYGTDPERLFADFQGLYRIIEAAGGLVFNPAGEALFIYRMGLWDLPKGKIDPGETPLEAALREVREETGLTELSPGPELPTTYHTYRLKDKRVLKRTWWFVMHTPQLELTPQTEEDIEKAVWAPIGAFLQNTPDIYGNIRDLAEGALAAFGGEDAL